MANPSRSRRGGDRPAAIATEAETALARRRTSQEAVAEPNARSARRADEAGRVESVGRGGAPAAPDLNFLMEGEGKVWRVGYNLQTGLLTGRPEDAPRVGEPLSNRRFFLRLHTAHGYPSQLNARWIWAVAVDVMFVCMVGWGITGLLMWWQMKNVRRIGVVLLVLQRDRVGGGGHRHARHDGGRLLS